MTESDDEPLARILLIWPGPESGPLGGISFIVEYETESGTGTALLSPQDLAEQNIAEAYRSQCLVPVPAHRGAQR